MKLIPYLMNDDGTINRRLTEVPEAVSIEEAKAHMSHLPKHLERFHVEYIEQLESDNGEPLDQHNDLRPCEGLDDPID